MAKKIEDDTLQLISENKTRKTRINKQLEAVDWKPSQWKDEVNSVKSNFKIKKYELFKDSYEKGVDRFIDYLLLAQDGSPLAIIEAKRYSKDPEEGIVQARTYQDDIQQQTGRIVPIFLTNSEKWVYIDHRGRQRKVSGPFSQDDLERREQLYRNEKDPSRINSKIVDRSRSILNVKTVTEHLAQGHRKALIHMATGTGKTRVAMALIDILVKAGYVQNVLFVADRIALAKQAYADGFKKFFKEPICELHKEGFKTTARFYTSTVQTLMGKNNNRMVDKFSPAFFDLIIFDEAHRSQFDRRYYVHKYFDAIKIGLTATPRDQEDKNTFDLFDCKKEEPTVEYSYDEAIRDRVLVPYNAIVVETENLSLGIRGKALPPSLKAKLRMQGVNPDNFEVEGSDFERVFLDDKTNELIVAEYMKACIRSAEGLPCKTIFFCRSKKHARRVKKAFSDLYPNLSREVQVIVSDYRSDDEVNRFKQRSDPRIALSVGMLDTGVDFPEVCNLVFIGPVYSHIRFWQMLGRGTRNLEACTHRDWLPQNEGGSFKNDFLLLDFQFGDENNIKLHKLARPQRKKDGKDIITEIFEHRVGLLAKNLTPSQKKIIVDKLHEDLKALNDDSFIVREKLSTIQRLRRTFDLDKHIKELNDEVKPLMLMLAGKSPKVMPFILQVEKLFYAIVTSNPELEDKIHSYVYVRLENINAKSKRIDEVKAKKDFIQEVLDDNFWHSLTFEKVEKVIEELAPLMKYYEPLKGDPIDVPKDDMIIKREAHIYKVKEDTRMEEFLSKSPIVKRIKEGDGVTCLELRQLEIDLMKLNPAYTVENIQEALKVDFLIFIHQMIGLSRSYDPKALIEREFDKHIIESEHYNAKQVEFLQMLKKVFSNRKFIQLEDLGKEPFKDHNPLDLFKDVEELKKIIAKVQAIRMK